MIPEGLSSEADPAQAATEIDSHQLSPWIDIDEGASLSISFLDKLLKEFRDQIPITTREEEKIRVIPSIFLLTVMGQADSNGTRHDHQFS